MNINNVYQSKKYVNNIHHRHINRLYSDVYWLNCHKKFLNKYNRKILIKHTSFLKQNNYNVIMYCVKHDIYFEFVIKDLCNDEIYNLIKLCSSKSLLLIKRIENHINITPYLSALLILQPLYMNKPIIHKYFLSKVNIHVNYRHWFPVFCFNETIKTINYLYDNKFVMGNLTILRKICEEKISINTLECFIKNMKLTLDEFITPGDYYLSAPYERAIVYNRLHIIKHLHKKYKMNVDYFTKEPIIKHIMNNNYTDMMIYINNML